MLVVLLLHEIGNLLLAAPRGVAERPESVDGRLERGDFGGDAFGFLVDGVTHARADATDPLAEQLRRAAAEDQLDLERIDSLEVVAREAPIGPVGRFLPGVALDDEHFAIEPVVGLLRDGIDDTADRVIVA
jgi:hypothetical protein